MRKSKWSRIARCGAHKSSFNSFLLNSGPLQNCQPFFVVVAWSMCWLHILSMRYDTYAHGIWIVQFPMSLWVLSVRRNVPCNDTKPFSTMCEFSHESTAVAISVQTAQDASNAMVVRVFEHTRALAHYVCGIIKAFWSNNNNKIALHYCGELAERFPTEKCRWFA